MLVLLATIIFTLTKFRTAYAADIQAWASDGIVSEA